MENEACKQPAPRYTSPISQPKTAALDEAMAALQRLPEDTQMALAEELVALAEDYQTPGLTDAQRDIVAGRLAEPRSHMPHL